MILQPTAYPLGHVRFWALKHRQLPFTAGLVEAQDVDVAVVALDLEVTIISPVPLVVALDDFDLAPTEMQSSRQFNSTIIGNAFNMHPHGWLRLSRSQQDKVTRYDGWQTSHCFFLTLSPLGWQIH